MVLHQLHKLHELGRLHRLHRALARPRRCFTRPLNPHRRAIALATRVAFLEPVCGIAEPTQPLARGQLSNASTPETFPTPPNPSQQFSRLKAARSDPRVLSFLLHTHLHRPRPEPSSPVQNNNSLRFAPPVATRPISFIPWLVAAADLLEPAVSCSDF